MPNEDTQAEWADKDTSEKVNVLMSIDLNSTTRPKEFPKELWSMVCPKQKPKVKARYESFKSQEYLEECIKKVRDELDIYERDEFYSPYWMMEADEGWSQRDTLMAQALANLDIFFFPDPDKVKMAKDVVAEVETIDDKPHKCRTRKLSVVQQAFLQTKTNIMLRMKQLEEAKSDWCWWRMKTESIGLWKSMGKRQWRSYFWKNMSQK